MHSSESFATLDIPDAPKEEKQHGIPRVFTAEEQEIIERKRKLLTSIAYFIGKDFEIPVELNESGAGWHWDFKNNIIRVDPIDLLEKPDEYLRFVIAHEGGHRRITRTEFIPDKVWGQTGFPFMMNAIEDPRMNNFVAESYPRFREQMNFAYEMNLEEEEKMKKSAPEKLGFVPKHIQAGFEYIRQWFRQTKGEKMEISPDLPEDVRAVVEKTLVAAEDSWFHYPSKREADTSDVLISKYAEKSYNINLEQIWPEFKKLVEEDVKKQISQEALRDTQKSGKDRHGASKVEQGDGQQTELPDDLKDKLTPAESEALRKALEESMQGGEPVPFDTFSPELQKKIADYVDSLPEEKKQELREHAEKAIAEFDEAINKALESMFEKEKGHEEKKEDLGGEEKGDKKPKSDISTKKESSRTTRPDTKDIKKAIHDALEGNKTVYEKYREEVLPVVDKLEDDLREIFVQRRSQKWQAGFKSGKHIDIKRRIQERAKDVPVVESRAWERRELPKEKDYAIELLVDLSGSMRGEKIEETFKATIVLSEVLNRLSVQNEIVGFNDRLHIFKSFTESFSDDVREKMGAMLEEVSSSRASYNDDGWALQEVATRLRKESQDEKFLIVLSDGIPEPSGEHSGEEFDLEKIVKKLVQEGKEKLVGLGIGSGTGHVSRYYPNSIADVSVTKMAEKLSDLLREIIEHGDQF